MRIAQAAFDWGAEVALTSPPSRERHRSVAEVAKSPSSIGYIINIQGDEPLIDPRLIDRLVTKLAADRRIGIITAAHPFDDPSEASSPHQVKVVIDRKGRALFFSRSPIPYLRHKDAR